MPSIVKLKGSETSVTSATDLSGAKLVRVYAVNTSVVTLADASSNVIGSFTIPAGRVEYVEKASDDLISANVAVLCTSVSYNT